jgi:hypothetical protein
MQKNQDLEDGEVFIDILDENVEKIDKNKKVKKRNFN